MHRKCYNRQLINNFCYEWRIRKVVSSRPYYLYFVGCFEHLFISCLPAMLSPDSTTNQICFVLQESHGHKDLAHACSHRPSPLHLSAAYVPLHSKGCRARRTHTFAEIFVSLDVWHLHGPTSWDKLGHVWHSENQIDRQDSQTCQADIDTLFYTNQLSTATHLKGTGWSTLIDTLAGSLRVPLIFRSIPKS